MRAFAVCLVLLGSLALAQEASTEPLTEPLTLAQALELAPANDPDVITAKADLVAAEQALTRQLADPLALTVGDLEAESTAASAQAALFSARLTNRSETSSLFFATLSADAAKEVATRTLALERSSYEATQIRADAGAASGLELLTARNSFEAAQREKQGADEASLLAYRELADALGLTSAQLLLRGLEVVAVTTPAVPTLADSLVRAQRENTDVAAARTAVRLAEAELTVSDTIFSARVDIEAAEDEVTRAKSDLAAALRQLTLSVRSASNDLTSAARSLADAQATRRAYAQELEAQRTRLQVGAISQSAFGEAELTDLENAQAVRSAFYTVQSASLALEKAVVGSGATESAVSGASDTEVGATDSGDVQGSDVQGSEAQGSDEPSNEVGEDTSGAALAGEEAASDAGTDAGEPETEAPTTPEEGDVGTPASP